MCPNGNLQLICQVAQMEVELPSMPVSIRQTYQTRLTTSKQGLDKIKKTLVCFGWTALPPVSIPLIRQRDVRAESARAELLSFPSAADDPYSDEPSDAFSARTRLLQGTETLTDSSQRLDNAHRIALETEDVGADILRNLRGQREQIEHTRDTVSASDHGESALTGSLSQLTRLSIEPRER